MRLVFSKLKNGVLATLLIIFSCQIGLAQIFVDADATGAKDGTSWTDAYTDVQMALDSAMAGDQIWVAEGIYHPGGMMPTDSSNFTIPVNGVKLYGGFDGSETMLSERDLENHLTVLSGDLNKDDIIGAFDTNRTDNTLHVMVIAPTVDTMTMIDGFVISGGHSEDTVVGDGNNRRGGGILCFGSPIIRNCLFTHNYAFFGGGMYPRLGDAADLVLEDCAFVGNWAGHSGGAIISVLAVSEIINCHFEQNVVNPSGGYGGGAVRINSSSPVFTNCTFENNLGPFGGAIIMDSSSAATDPIFIECEFTGNRAMVSGTVYAGPLTKPEFYDCDFTNGLASFGGAINVDNALVLADGCEFSTNIAFNAGGSINVGEGGLSAFNCSFDSDTSSFGGSIYNEDGLIYIDSCSFDGNLATTVSGALHNFNATAVIENSDFSGNIAPWGGAMQNSSSLVDVFGCSFEGNIAENGGGAMLNGFLADVVIEDCDFELNSATNGGALYNQNDTTVVVIDDCYFGENEATGDGGALAISGQLNVVIESSEFMENEANVGGAIHIESSGDYLPGFGVLEIYDSYFEGNYALERAGAINVSNAEVYIENALIADNSIGSNGIGGGISNNGAEGDSSIVDLMNVTMANNLGTIGDNIAQWTDSDTSTALLYLQNTILYGALGNNYALEDGSPMVISNGGNLNSDTTMNAALTGMKDVNDTDPLFVDEVASDFHLSPTSPCIDDGIDTDAPLEDIEGNPTVAIKDKGAFEYPYPVNTTRLNEANGLELLPNPVVNASILSIDNDWTGKINLQIVNTVGQVVQEQVVTKNQTQQQYPLNVKGLAAGTYQIVLKHKRYSLVETLVKH